jgi:hypothetical protein
LFGIAARDQQTLGPIGYETAAGRFYIGPLLADLRHLTFPFLRWLLFGKADAPYLTRWRWQDRLAGMIVIRTE